MKRKAKSQPRKKPTRVIEIKSFTWEKISGIIYTFEQLPRKLINITLNYSGKDKRLGTSVFSGTITAETKDAKTNGV